MSNQVGCWKQPSETLRTEASLYCLHKLHLWCADRCKPIFLRCRCKASYSLASPSSNQNKWTGVTFSWIWPTYFWTKFLSWCDWIRLKIRKIPKIGRFHAWCQPILCGLCFHFVIPWKTNSVELVNTRELVELRSAQIKSLDHSSVRFGNKITCRKMVDFNSEKMWKNVKNIP